ncbi:DUF3040 domain-containing protein [Dactylosporangium sp. CA-233914]|uniref:DUF3040 domain-containing protein n=1 Tax=Dactylosporangium sp. CA-233914 TaxID=3239934 RepID=UPI003D8DC414
MVSPTRNTERHLGTFGAFTGVVGKITARLTETRQSRRPADLPLSRVCHTGSARLSYFASRIHRVSEIEQWQLAQVEREIAGDDPELARALSRLEPVRRWRTRLSTCAMLSAGCAVPASILAHDMPLAVISAGALGIAAGIWQPLA